MNVGLKSGVPQKMWIPPLVLIERTVVWRGHVSSPNTIDPTAVQSHHGPKRLSPTIVMRNGAVAQHLSWFHEARPATDRHQRREVASFARTPAFGPPPSRCRCRCCRCRCRCRCCRRGTACGRRRRGTACGGRGRSTACRSGHNSTCFSCRAASVSYRPGSG